MTQGNKRPNFLRRSHDRYAKFGKGVKKNLKWRRPSGRDNKMREKRRGYPAVISVGYKNEKIIRGKLAEKNPIRIMNLKDLEKLGKNDIAVIGGVGKKKKLEIAKVAKEKKIEVYNMNAGKFLKLNETKKKVEEKSESTKKIKEEKK